MKRTARTLVFVAGALALVVVGIALGRWWSATRAPMSVTPAARPAQQVLYWYDPMVPEQHFDHPGKSPFMDMQLVPRYADAAAASSVRIAPRLQQNLGVRSAVVEVGRLASELRVPGTLTWDLRLESVVSTPVSAIVSRVAVKAPFEPVHRGQLLVTLLAPDWSAALAEARSLDQAQSPAARELRAAAQARLHVLGVPSGGAGGAIGLAAPRAGVVSEVLAREGQAVGPGTPLFRINGLQTLWLEADIPQAGSAGIGPGTPVQARVSAMPGATFDGRVEALLPQIDTASRTQRARIVLRNDGGRLVPGMFAELTLRGDQGRSLPLVPTEALITTGADSRVIVATKDGNFQPVHVEVGRSIGGRTEILAGLQGGERVVTSGQFLIDSEASLSGALQRLPPAAGAQR